MKKKLSSWLALLLACIMLSSVCIPNANAVMPEKDVYPQGHDGYIGLTQYVQHMSDNVFKVQLTLEPSMMSTTVDCVLLIDASENMLARAEGGKTYFEYAAEAAYSSAQIWLNNEFNPLGLQSTRRNRVWIVFYNGKAYDVDGQLLQTGILGSPKCYITDQCFDDPQLREYKGLDPSGYRPMRDLRAHINSTVAAFKAGSNDMRTEPGAFNTDINAFNQRYTAAGLAAAYDIYADYSDKSDMEGETNRKITILLSNGPDYERDNIKATDSGKLPQEGSMRMEALFMAKALKLQQHSYGSAQETALKLAAEQIAAADGNSYNHGVIQAPALGTPAYSPLSLDTHRVEVAPPDESGTKVTQIRYLNSSRTSTDNPSSPAWITGSYDNFPVHGANVPDTIDPFAFWSIRRQGEITHDGTTYTGTGYYYTDSGRGQHYSSSEFEYIMFADTAPVANTPLTTAPGQFDHTIPYLSVLNTIDETSVPRFTNQTNGTSNNAYTSPNGGGPTRRPLDGWGYKFDPNGTDNTTYNTQVYTYATTPANGGPDITLPLKDSYERIAGVNAAGSTPAKSGGQNAEIWVVGLFAGNDNGPNTLGTPNMGPRLYSHGASYGYLDSRHGNLRGWLQNGTRGATAVGALPAEAHSYHTDFMGYTYGLHDRPEHISLRNTTAGSYNLYLTASSGGPSPTSYYQSAGLTNTNENGYATGTIRTNHWLNQNNAETGASIQGRANEPFGHTIGANAGDPWNGFSINGWTETGNYTLKTNIVSAGGQITGRYSFIKPNPNMGTTNTPYEYHTSPNLGDFSPGPLPNALTPTLQNYQTNPDTGNPEDEYRSMRTTVNNPPEWFDTISWKEVTTASGTSTQNDDSTGTVTGTTHNRHNQWPHYITTALPTPSGHDSIPKPQTALQNGVDAANRKQLQKHFWALSGVQTDKIAHGAGFDPALPWQNRHDYYWSKQTFLTTTRLRRDNPMPRMTLTEQAYSGGSPPASNVWWSSHSYHGAGPHAIWNGTNYGSTSYSWDPTFTYPWVSSAATNEGFSSQNADYQNFYEYIGFNYTLSAYQTALTQTLDTLRYDHPINQQYDKIDHQPVVEMITTTPNSLFDIDAESVKYNRLIRAFEDLTYGFYRVAEGGSAITQLSEWFDFYKMPGRPQFDVQIRTKLPTRYSKNTNGKYDSGTKTVSWNFDDGIYAGINYQISFYITMDEDTDPSLKYPFQVESYLANIEIRSMWRQNRLENNNRFVVVKNFPHSYVSGIKGVDSANIVVMNDYVRDISDTGGTIAVFPEGPGVMDVLPYYTASVTPAPKQLKDEEVDEETSENLIPNTGALGIAALAIVGGLAIAAIVIKKKSRSQ